MKADVLLVTSEIDYHILRYWHEALQQNTDSVTLGKVMKIVDGLAENAEFFVNLFRRLDPLAAGKRVVKKPLYLKKTIESVLSVFENEMKIHNVSAEIIGPDDFKFSSWSQDIYAIFTNLVDIVFIG